MGQHERCLKGLGADVVRKDIVGKKDLVLFGAGVEIDGPDRSHFENVVDDFHSLSFNPHQSIHASNDDTLLQRDIFGIAGVNECRRVAGASGIRKAAGDLDIAAPQHKEDP